MRVTVQTAFGANLALTNGYFEFTGNVLNPSFYPYVGVAASATPVTFSDPGGSLDGGYVVLTTTNCTDPQLEITSSNSLSKQIIQDDQIALSTLMTAVTTLYVCFAAAASAGDEKQDYIQLPNDFVQRVTPVYNPKRTIKNAAQILFLREVLPSDQVAFKRKPADAAANPCSNSIVQGTDSTAIHTVTQTIYYLQIPTFLLADTFVMCYKPNGGAWTRMASNAELSIENHPLFTPTAGPNGHDSVMTFSGTAAAGDAVTIHKTDCNTAHQAYTSTGSMLRTVLTASLTITVPAAMTDASPFILCYATKEAQESISAGDSVDDYASLTQKWVQLDFNPKRTIRGAPQNLILEGALYGALDQVLWTLSSCPGPSTFVSTASDGPLLTRGFTITEPTPTLAFTSVANYGSWKMCYRSNYESVSTGVLT